MRIAGAALMLLTVACRADLTTGPTGAVAGSWALTTINGDPLPYLIGANDTARVDLLSETITATANGTFAQRKNYQVTLTGLKFPSFDIDSGTVSLEGNVATLIFATDGSRELATFTDTTLTFSGSGFVAVFRRQ